MRWLASLLWWASEWSGIGLGRLAPHVLGWKLGSGPVVQMTLTDETGTGRVVLPVESPEDPCRDCPHPRGDHCGCTRGVRHCTQCFCIDYVWAAPVLKGEDG